MKNNPLFAPLFYKKSNANVGKKSRARKILISGLLCLLSFTSIYAVSFSGTSASAKIKGAAVYAVFLAFPAGVQGTKALHGTDESKEDFEARKGKAETEEAFAKRIMFYEIGQAVKRASDEWKTELDAIKTKLEALKPNDTEGLDALKEEMRKHGLQINALKDIKMGLDRGIKPGSLKELFIQNKEKFEAMKSKSLQNFQLEYKSSATDTSTDIGDRATYDAVWHEPGIVGQIPVRKWFLKNLFKNSAAAAEYIKYRDQLTVVRSAANVALCATSNSTTKATWQTNTIQITKIRDFMDVCLDMMNDYAFVESEIRNLIDSSVQLKIDDQLLNGTGTYPETNSLSSIASTWNATISGIKDWAGQVAKANLVDLIIVAQTQVQQLGQNNAFMPNYVLLNPGDWATLMLIKNDFGDSIKYYPGLYVDNAGNIRINGMLLIPNPNITANTFYIGDFTKGTVYNISGVGIEFSYENATNFETETVTVKAYQRLNLLVRKNDTNAFMKCTDIIAAIAAINHP